MTYDLTASMSHYAPFALALALAAGIVIQCAARSIRVPAIILLLASGVLLGPAGLNWIRPAELGESLFMVVDFAIAIILFEGALNLKIQRLRREERAIRRLVLWGAMVTLAGGAAAARLWLGWPWTLALLFGSLVVVTGPTVVGPLVRDLRLHPRLQTVLEAEGVLIDPVGALLAVLVFQVTLATDAFGVVSEFGALLGRITFGVAAGAVGGLIISGFLRLPAVVHGYENALTLGLVVFFFHVSDLLFAPSGLLVVTVAGLVVGNLENPAEEELREFKDQLTVLLIGAVFILLAADIALADIASLGWAGAAVLATIILVVRPAGVWIATWRSTLSTRERLFVSAIAPRGIVAAAIVSLTASTLDERGVAGGDELRALVFLVIAGTVFAAGAAAWPLATLLGLRLPARDRTAILGAQGLGLALGRVLRDAGKTVIFVDSDPQRCRVVQDEGFPVVFGDGLHERTLRRIPIELVGTAVGATFNDNLNSQFAHLAQETFGVKRAYAAVDSLDNGRPPQHVARFGLDVLFEGPHDEERWDVRWRQGQVEIIPAEWAGLPAVAPLAGRPPDDLLPKPERESFVILAITRGGQTFPMTLSTEPRTGDEASIALFTEKRDEAIEALRRAGWQPVARPEPEEVSVPAPS